MQASTACKCISCQQTIAAGAAALGQTVHISTQLSRRISQTPAVHSRPEGGTKPNDFARPVPLLWLAGLLQERPGMRKLIICSMWSSSEQISYTKRFLPQISYNVHFQITLSSLLLMHFIYPIHENFQFSFFMNKI